MDGWAFLPAGFSVPFKTPFVEMFSLFDQLSRYVSEWLGSPVAFAGAIILVALWAASGPYFGWSDTHQLIVNTGTTIATFWMMFLLQSSQNRDTKAIHTKLDELIRVSDARNEIMLAEDISPAELERLKQQLQRGI